jgi:hypothetical protein
MFVAVLAAVCDLMANPSNLKFVSVVLVPVFK